MIIISSSPGHPHQVQHTNLSRRSVTTRILSTVAKILLTNFSSCNSLAMTTQNKGVKIIDTHLHVWANREESRIFPYAEGQTPPQSLIDVGSTHSLISQMSKCGVDGALIVQPITHKFDHSYVLAALKSHPSKFKGMLLFNPTQPESDAINNLNDFMSKGFVGVRFNPYLWPEGQTMSESSSGMAVYRQCGELGVPVGIMCFKGLHLHYNDILNLIHDSPKTTLILDHFGFTRLEAEDQQDFEKLLNLSQYPNVVVKIAALFRIGSTDPYPYEKLRSERFAPLVKAFGSDRLMFGTDFPYVMEQKGEYHGAVEVVQSWAAEYGEEEERNIMSGTAERLFGAWGTNPVEEVGFVEEKQELRK